METNWMFYVTRINKLVRQIEDIRDLHNPIWDKSWETFVCLECDSVYPCDTALIVMRHDNDDIYEEPIKIPLSEYGWIKIWLAVATSTIVITNIVLTMMNK